MIKEEHYEFNVMPFSLYNALATFQKMMNKVLEEYIDRFIAVFIDDILLFIQTVLKNIVDIVKYSFIS
jgi:hypothetical protein